MDELIKKIYDNRVQINDCMIWSKGLNTDGYGKTYHNNKTLAVHRVVFFYYFPDADKSMNVHHWCGNRSCSNIDHLRLVTHEQNKAESRRVIDLENKLTIAEDSLAAANAEIEKLQRYVDLFM